MKKGLYPLVILSILLIFSYCENATERPPNIIYILADDLGYGDIGVFNSEGKIKTPQLDLMAQQGMVFTDAHTTSSVCTPTRYGILTGRYNWRSPLKKGVLSGTSSGLIPKDRTTVASFLKSQGYQTAFIGKWHLGHKKAYLPLQHGFDYYYGIPYSNDMDVPQEIIKEKGGYENLIRDPKNNMIENFQVPLIQNNEIIERPADQNNITNRYSDETIKFIKNNKNKPFFIYLAHNLPHVPLFASKKVLGKSSRGLYGDVVEEIDQGVGKILNTLKEEGLNENTLVVFTSDNGPWTVFNEQGGSAGLLRAGKGTTWEGGMREPTIFWAPKMISPGIVDNIGSTMDLFNTFSKIAGVSLPEDRILDSYDLTSLLFENKNPKREYLFYYRGTDLYALRLGDFKAHYVTQGAYGQFGGKEIHNPPLLYNLNHDPSEQYNIADQYPNVLQAMKSLVAVHQEKMIASEDQLKSRGVE